MACCMGLSEEIGGKGVGMWDVSGKFHPLIIADD